MAKLESILQIAPDALIERAGWNVRLADDPDNIAHTEELAESIFHVGVLEPLTAYLSPRENPVFGKNVDDIAEVRDRDRDRYVVTNGHFRLAAVRIAIARGAPIKTVPVRLEPKTANEADYTFGMIARNAGKPLSQLELGQACKRLAAFGWSDADLTAKSGYSLQHIRNVLALASAPVEVTRLVETGQVSASLATQAIAAEGNEGAAETLVAAVAIAREEDAAKPKRGRPAKSTNKPAAPAPVKATLKHVAKAKGSTRTAATKATYNKKDKAALTPSEIVEHLTNANIVNSLQQFDALVKPRAQVYELLIHAVKTAWGAPAGKDAGGDDAAFELQTVADLLGRAVADTADADGIVTVVLPASDWEAVCATLKIKQVAAPSAEENATRHEHEYGAL